MGMGGGIVYGQTEEERLAGVAAAQEPGACGARAKHLAWAPATQRCLSGIGSADDFIPIGGGGVGFDVPCQREDCEVGEPVPHGACGFKPCPRWVRLARAAATTPTENDPCGS